MAAKSSSQGSAAAWEIRVDIQDDNHDNQNIEHQDNIQKISSEDWKRQLARIRRDTAKKKRITKRSSGKMGNAARWSNNLILYLTDENEARPCL